MKMFVKFFVIVAYILAVLGGIGYTWYDGAYVIAAAIIVLALMAFPVFKRFFDEFI